MNSKMKIFLAAILIIIGVCIQETICGYLGFEQESQSEISSEPIENAKIDEIASKNYFINDTIYSWSDTLLRWIAVEKISSVPNELVGKPIDDISSSDPIEVDWQRLMDIGYRLQYFEEKDMEMYSPVFPPDVKALHKQIVVIEGFVIPFDEEGDFLSLSFNPYASCFFCGNASPASVLSMYLKKKGKRYKIDDFKKFKGKLYLNQDDPNEFYYVLRDAEEVK